MSESGLHDCYRKNRKIQIDSVAFLLVCGFVFGVL